MPVTIEVDGEEVKNDSKIKSGNTYKVESSSEGNKAGYIEKITITKNSDDSGSGGTSGRETGGKV